MKKFIFATCLLALSAMIPAVFVGYLNDNKQANVHSTEVAKETTSGQEEPITLHFIRTF